MSGEFRAQITVDKQALKELIEQISAFNDDDGECYLCHVSSWNDETEEYEDLVHTETCPIRIITENPTY